MKTNLLFVLMLQIVFVAEGCLAQPPHQADNYRELASIPRHAIYAEYFGNGGYYSLNYEAVLIHRNRMNINFRIGASILKYKQSTNPLLLSAVLGKRKCKADVGFGVLTYWNWDFEYRKKFKQAMIDSQPMPFMYPPLLTFIPTASVGFRYQSDMGLFYKIAFTPLLLIHPKELHFLPWAGVGAGYFFGYKRFKG